MKFQTQLPYEFFFLRSEIGDLKKKIQEVDGHETAHQTLIFSGKILTDDRALKELGLKPTDFFVCMIRKVDSGV